MKHLLGVALLVSVASAHGAVLFDNGPFITGNGNGAGGGDTSAIAAGETTFGFGAQKASGNAVAEDFVLAENSTLSTLTVYAYQTNATTATITGGSFAIYSVAPATQASTPLAGNLGTVVATSTAFTNVYRVTDTALTSAARRIQAVTFDLGGLNLAAGTYYVAWAMTGSSNSSGPWAVPLSPNPANANSLQSVSSGAFTPLVDTTTNHPAALAFQIGGTSAVPEPATFAALGLGAAALLRRRKKA